jgi:hypothetical protein
MDIARGCPVTAQTDLEALLARAQQLADADRCSSVAAVAAPKGQNQHAGAANPERKSTPSPATVATSLQLPWGPEDWGAFFDERAGIRESDGRQSRQEAEQQALAETIEYWRAFHPMVPSGPEIGCVHCREGGGDPNLVPHLASDKGALWLHTTCWPAFDRARREEALAALRLLIPDLPKTGASK